MLNSFTGLILDIFLVYISGIVTTRFLFIEKKHDFFSGYFVIILLLIFAFRISFIYKNRLYRTFSRFKLNTRWIIVTLFFLGAGVLNCIQEFKLRDIWLDEYTQFKYGTPVKLLWSNVVTNSAIEQQPPLDYFFSSAAYTFFGWTDYAVRFHSILFFFLFLLVFSLFLFEKTKSLFFTSAGLAICSIAPAFRHFSIEARPLNLSLFMGMLFFIQVIEYFSKEDNKLSFSLFLSIFFFSLSIGFQPVIIVICLSLILFFFYYSSRRENAIKFLLHSVLGGLAVAPIMLNIYLESKKLHQFVENQTFFESVIKKFQLNQLISMFNFALTPFEYEGLIVLFLLLIFLVVNILKKEKNIINISLLTFCLLFPLIYYSVFLGIINWPFFNKYYFAFSGILISVVLVLAWDLLNTKVKALRLEPIIIIFLISPFFFLKTRSPLFRFKENYVYDKTLYKHLSASQGINVAINFNFSKLKQWRGENWISREIYGSEKIFFHDTRIAGFLHNFYVQWNDLPVGDFVNIHLIQKNDKRLYNIDFNDILAKLNYAPSFKQFGIHNVYTFRVPRKTVEEYWKTFLQRISNQLSDEYKYLFLETKITESIMKKNLPECLSLSQEYRKLKIQAHMDTGESIDTQNAIDQILTVYNCKQKINNPIPQKYSFTLFRGEYEKIFLQQTATP